jgi:crossover junction endodeoxyribonuclease RuvC
MLVIGIDPGTASTGFGLVEQSEDGRLSCVEAGVLSTPAGQPMAERLLSLYAQLNEVLLLHRPESAAVEKLYFQKNVTTALSVGQARGVAMLALAQAGLEISEYAPREIKLAVTGYGAADKGQVQRMVQTLLEMPELPRPDDAADALAVAICHVHSRQIEART